MHAILASAANAADNGVWVIKAIKVKRRRYAPGRVRAKDFTNRKWHRTPNIGPRLQ